MSGMIVILLLFAEGESLSAAFKYEGQQRRTLVKSMSQQARADVVSRPWLTQTEAAEQGLRKRSALSTPKGVSKAGVALGSFTGRKDGLTLDRPTLATTMSRATVLDGYKADPACRGLPYGYGSKCTHGGGRGARVGVQGGYDRTRPVQCARHDVYEGQVAQESQLQGMCKCWWWRSCVFSIALVLLRCCFGYRYSRTLAVIPCWCRHSLEETLAM